MTVDEAFAEFKKAWEAQDYTDDRVIPALTDAETEALFPRVRNLADIPKLGEAIKGPIRVGVYRFNKKSITDPQRMLMPNCIDLLMKQDNFYFHEPDALIAGGNEFSRWFKQTWLPVVVCGQVERAGRPDYPPGADVRRGQQELEAAVHLCDAHAPGLWP